jgi:hypothetical protein
MVGTALRVAAGTEGKYNARGNSANEDLAMTHENLETLARQAAAGEKAAADKLCLQIDSVLRQLDQATLKRVVQAALDLNQKTGPEGALPATPYTPEFLEWARGLSTDEEVIAELRDLREHGGHEFTELLRDIESSADRP